MVFRISVCYIDGSYKIKEDFVCAGICVDEKEFSFFCKDFRFVQYRSMGSEMFAMQTLLDMIQSGQVSYPCYVYSDVKPAVWKTLPLKGLSLRIKKYIKKGKIILLHCDSKENKAHKAANLARNKKKGVEIFMCNEDKLIRDIEKKISTWNERSQFKLKGIGNLSRSDLDVLRMYADFSKRQDYSLMEPRGRIKEVLDKYDIAWRKR